MNIDFKKLLEIANERDDDNEKLIIKLEEEIIKLKEKIKTLE